MRFTYILLIALVALALHLAWTGIVAPAFASGNAGAGGGDVHARVLEPAIAGGAYGGVLGPSSSLAASKPTSTGDFRAGVGAPALAGRKPGVSPGSGV
jgi:hypothetical protein